MKSKKMARRKDLEAQRPGNPNQTGQQHNPSRLDPQIQQDRRHRDKLSKQNKS